MGDLNHQVLHDMETDLYFTMVLADPNLETGLLRFAQAGHPHPVLQSSDNAFLHLGTGACLWVLLTILRLSVPNT